MTININDNFLLIDATNNQQINNLQIINFQIHNQHIVPQNIVSKKWQSVLTQAGKSSITINCTGYVINSNTTLQQHAFAATCNKYILQFNNIQLKSTFKIIQYKQTFEQSAIPKFTATLTNASKITFT